LRGSIATQCFFSNENEDNVINGIKKEKVEVCKMVECGCCKHGCLFLLPPYWLPSKFRLQKPKRWNPDLQF
jgi:hypothetical protein